MHRSAIHLGIALFAALMITTALGCSRQGQAEFASVPAGEEKSKPRGPARTQDIKTQDIKEAPLPRLTEGMRTLDIKDAPLPRLTEGREGPVPDKQWAYFTNHWLDDACPDLRGHLGSFIFTEFGTANAQVAIDGKIRETKLIYHGEYRCPAQYEGKIRDFYTFKQSESPFDVWLLEKTPGQNDNYYIFRADWKSDPYEMQPTLFQGAMRSLVSKQEKP